MAKSSRILFIIGTDTEVGKTYCTCELLRELLLRGVDAYAVKPVETDCSAGAEPADATAILKVIRENKLASANLETINFYALPGAVSPSVASRDAGVKLKAEQIAKRIRFAAEDVDLLLVESAGGLLSPVGEDFSFLDLAKTLKADVLLVAASKLGVLNHAMLSMELLKQNKLNLLGYLLNEVSPAEEPQKLARETNPAELKRVSRDIAGKFGDFGLLRYTGSGNSLAENREIIAKLAVQLIDYYLIHS